jgi:putative salt-induced outer membrane protein YdiY
MRTILILSMLLAAPWPCVAEPNELAAPVDAGADVLLPPAKPLPGADVPEAKPLPKEWTGSLEFGLNGAEGNSQNLKLFAGGKVKRERPTDVFTLELNYIYAQNNSVLSENKAFLLAREEWPFTHTPWSLFADFSMEYDEFRAFDLRLAGHVGPSYALIKNDRITWKVRAGAGASNEIGGPNDDIVPELIMGSDLEWKFTERCKLTASGDYFPSLEDFGDYRINSKASLEFLVDPELNLTFKIGAVDRYDSTPEGRRPNDIEYFALLLWKF